MTSKNTFGFGPIDAETARERQQMKQLRGLMQAIWWRGFMVRCTK